MITEFKIFEKSYKNINIFEMIRKHNYEDVKKLIDDGFDVDFGIDSTPLIYAIKMKPIDIKIIELLAEVSDWTKKAEYGLKDFIEILEEINISLLDDIINKFPKKYEEYLLNKELDKFNI